MAKTELTRKIEEALFGWNPETLAGQRVNRMRQSFAGYEVPVKYGEKAEGIVDFVLVSECFLNERTQHYCSLARHGDADGLHTYVLDRAELVRCENTEMLIQRQNEPCKASSCKYAYAQKMHDFGIIVAAIEIKVTKSDFKSSHGHNFVGDANYYAMPAWLYPQVKDLVPDGIGVLLYYDGKNIEEAYRGSAVSYYGIRKKKECQYRPMNNSQKNWMILSTAKRALKREEDLIAELRKEQQKSFQFVF